MKTWHKYWPFVVIDLRLVINFTLSEDLLVLESNITKPNNLITFITLVHYLTLIEVSELLTSKEFDVILVETPEISSSFIKPRPLLQ